MKNIVRHESISERFQFLCGLLKTSLIDVKEVKQIVLKASQMPIFFFEYSNPVERAHFSIWWNGVGLRYGMYSNDWINDLHYIHELHHLVNKQIGYVDFDTWIKQKISEEFEASLFSEMSMYVLVPSLRDKTFKFDILVDEIKDPTLESVRTYRTEILDVPWANTESQNLIHKYARNNVLWGQIWADVAESIELQMNQLYLDSDSLTAHLEWLESVSVDGVPFKENGVLFMEQMEH